MSACHYTAEVIAAGTLYHTLKCLQDEYERVRNSKRKLYRPFQMLELPNYQQEEILSR
jgi:protein-tyrosine phosphatase